jgi:hypothetical protein
VDPDDFHQGLDPEVGEGHDALVSDAKDPDEAVLGVHFVGDRRELVLSSPRSFATRAIVVTE